MQRLNPVIRFGSTTFGFPASCDTDWLTSEPKGVLICRLRCKLNKTTLPNGRSVVAPARFTLRFSILTSLY